MKTIQIITSYSIQKEPVIKNRLDPLINLLLYKKYQIILISNDNKKISYPTKNFSHILVHSNFKKTKNLFLRSLLELKLSLKMIKNSRKLNGDLIFVTIPSVFLMFFLFKLRDKKLHLDIRDLVWEYLFKNQLVLKVIKVIKIKEDSDIDKYKNYDIADFILFDTPGMEKSIEFPKNLIMKLPKGKKYALAGSISEDNVENIIKLGVNFFDLSSNLENQIGYKDHHKIKSFINKINEFKN